MEDKNTVLVVDDDPRILATINRLLRPRYRVLLAEGGEQALALLRQNKVQIVVSDQRMPSMTGVELLTKVKQVSPQSLRVLLTGYSDLEAIEQAINKGEVYRFLNKPWKNSEFLDLMAECIVIYNNIAQAEPVIETPVVANNKTKEAMLLLDAGNDLYPVIEPLFKNRMDILYAGGEKQAVQHIGEGQVSVILLALSKNSDSELALIKTLKTISPNVLVLVLADSRDAHQMIDLINEGQVYRYMTRPAKMGTLKMYLVSAMRYHQNLLQHPVLAQRHAVTSIKEKAQQKIAVGLLARFKSLGQIFRQRV